MPLRAHIYMRSVAAVWGRYRQEWSYYLHTVPESGTRAEPIATPFADANGDEAVDHLLGQALNQLSVEDQLLIRRLFWDNAGQRRVAAKLQISQQCVSRRKTRVPRQLRRLLNGQSQLFSHILALAGLCSTVSICSRSWICCSKHSRAVHPQKVTRAKSEPAAGIRQRRVGHN